MRVQSGTRSTRFAASTTQKKRVLTRSRSCLDGSRGGREPGRDAPRRTHPKGCVTRENGGRGSKTSGDGPEYEPRRRVAGDGNGVATWRSNISTYASGRRGSVLTSLANPVREGASLDTPYRQEHDKGGGDEGLELHDDAVRRR